MKPQTMERVHLVLTLVWVLTIIPTLIWWRESILWIAFMSLYAIVVSHWSCWQAARAEKSVKEMKGS